MAKQYDLLFNGTILDGFEPHIVKQKIGRMCKAEGEKLERLFSGKAIRLRNAVDADTAAKFRQAFLDAGARLIIRPVQAPTEAKPSDTTQQTNKPTTEITALPPRTGSLEECAKPVQPIEVPDTSHIHVAQVGINLDEKPAIKTAEIDISHLSASPANSGSLEDCVSAKAQIHAPDISHLHCVDE